LPTKIFFILSFFLVSTAFCGKIFFGKTFVVEYANGKTQNIKKAAFREKTYFRAKGRNEELNPKKLNVMDVFSDTIEIYYGEMWMRANVYPTTKDTVNIPVYDGWIKVNTVITGVSDLGKISASLTELKRVKFKVPKDKSKKESQRQVPPTTAASGGGENVTIEDEQVTEVPEVPEETAETEEPAEENGENATTATGEEEQNE